MSIKLIAHRGYAARYPENTLVAIHAAIEAGAQFVEVDVQLAADGAPVLFHDRTLDRICGVSGAIADYSAQQLARFSASEANRFGDAFADTPLATLHELAELIRNSPSTGFFIELKKRRSPALLLLEKTTRILEGVRQQCTLISFDTEILGMARMRGWRTGFIGEWEVGAGLERKKGDHSLSSPAKPETGKSKSAFFFPDPALLFCDVKGLPLSGDLHLPGIRLAVYEVTDPEQALRLAARGADFVETFAIGEMRAALSSS